MTAFKDAGVEGGQGHTKESLEGSSFAVTGCIFGFLVLLVFGYFAGKI
jgi:hypothetical protein